MLLYVHIDYTEVLLGTGSPEALSVTALFFFFFFIVALRPLRDRTDYLPLFVHTGHRDYLLYGQRDNKDY